MKKQTKLYPNMTIKDARGELRAAAAEINRLATRSDDYAGGVRFALFFTLDCLRNKAQSQEQPQEQRVTT